MTKRVHAVGIIFENSNGEILVLRRDKSQIEGEKWGLVGGNIDDGETLEQAVIRETSEEIGVKLTSDQLHPLKSFYWSRTEHKLTFTVFKTLFTNNTIPLKLDSHENSDYRWVNPSELYKETGLMKGLYSILEDVYGIK